MADVELRDLDGRLGGDVVLPKLRKWARPSSPATITPSARFTGTFPYMGSRCCSVVRTTVADSIVSGLKTRAPSAVSPPLMSVW